MISARDRTVDGFPMMPLETPQHLASWYTPGMSDWLGDRLLMFDNTNAPSWELLRFRPEVAATPGFEGALRERVARLDRFHHRLFPAVRGVEDLGSRNGLALVSTYVAGRRLSDALERPRSATVAMRLIRQLTPALAALHEQGDTIAHGALTADRIVLTTDARFMIREHVLGSALQHLRLSAVRLWVDLGVVVSPTGEAVPRLDRRTDVIQLALIALSLMLGRRIAVDEYPNKVDSLLDHVANTSCRRSPLVFPALRHWLERALQLRGRPFESARDANDGFSDWHDESQGEDADFELPASSAPGGALQRAVAMAPPHAGVGFPRGPAPALSADVEEAESDDRWRADGIDRYAPVQIPADESSTGALEVFPFEEDPSAERARSRATYPPRTKNEADYPRITQRSHATGKRRAAPLVAPEPVVDRSWPLRSFATFWFVLAVGEAGVIADLLLFSIVRAAPRQHSYRRWQPSTGIRGKPSSAGIQPLSAEPTRGAHTASAAVGFAGALHSRGKPGGVDEAGCHGRSAPARRRGPAPTTNDAKYSIARQRWTGIRATTARKREPAVGDRTARFRRRAATGI